MPINYQPAQPFAPAISEYYGSAMQNIQDAPGLFQAGLQNRQLDLQNRQLQFQRQQAQQSGLGNASAQAAQLQAGVAEADANRQQGAINNRDANDIQQREFAAQLGTQVNRDVFGHQSGMAQQEQRFRLQAELQDVELSQQEKIRLQRLNNAVGQISTDPTLTDEQKSEFIAQIKYNKSPLEDRERRQRMKIQEIEKDAMVENVRAQAAIRQEQAKFASLGFEDLHQFIPDPKALAAAVEEVGTANPGLPPDQIEKKARAITIQRGQGTAWVQESYGKWKQVDPFSPDAQGGKKGSSGSSGGSERPPKELDDVGALRQAKARLESQGVTVDDPKWADKIVEAVAAVKGENQGKIDHAKQGNAPAPVDPEAKRLALNKIAEEVTAYQNKPGWDDAEKAAAVGVTREIHRWIDKYGSADHFPPAVREKYEQFKKTIRAIEDKPRPVVPQPELKVPGQQVPGQPPGVVWDDQGRMGVWQAPERSFRGDVRRANEKTDQWARDARQKAEELNAKTDKWYEQLKDYVGGNK